MVVSLLYAGLVRRRHQSTQMSDTYSIIEYSDGDGRNVEDVPGSGELSSPNLRH